MRRALLALVALGLGATACTSGGSSAQNSPSASPTSAAPALSPWQPGDPTALVAVWRVELPGSGGQSSLVIGDKLGGGLSLFESCGLLQGSFRANGAGMFTGYIFGGSDACNIAASAPWLHRVVAFRRDGASEDLLDLQGSVVVRLVPGAHPRTGPDDSPDYAKAELSPQLLASFRTPALPRGVTAASRGYVLGKWLPMTSARANSRAFVEFKADGTWSGSDGCNGAGGSYVVGPDGMFVATNGASTLVGCNNSPLPDWPPQAGRVGMRNGQLVFVDSSGHVLGEARRARRGL